MLLPTMALGGDGLQEVKAIAVAGKGWCTLYDREAFLSLAEQIRADVASTPRGNNEFAWGTSMLFPGMLAMGALPIKNLNTNFSRTMRRFWGELSQE